MVGKRVTLEKGKGKGKLKVSSFSNDGVPDIYHEMLAEALPSVSDHPERPLKKRRAGRRRTADTNAPSNSQVVEREEEDDEDLEFEDVLEEALGASSPHERTTKQTIYRSDDSEESDVDWQPLDFDILEKDEPLGDLELTLTTRPAAKHQTTPRRKAVTKAERALRLEIHKMHILCLLSYLSRRNEWCDDSVVQKCLKPLLDKKVLQFLRPKSDLSQFIRTDSLKRGLEMVSVMWRKRFSITERGLRRALWAESPADLENYQLPDDSDSTFDRSDFRKAAERLEGSRDLGAQLYCALLRSAGVDARIVCSLQPLSFNTGGPAMPRMDKHILKKSAQEEAGKAAHPLLKRYNDFSADSQVSNPRRRLGHPFAAGYLVPHFDPPPPPPPKQKRYVIRESPYPLFWVEVLDEAHQKWLPVDPLVTESIAKARVFEPPAADHENNMIYVIAFDDTGCAKDVTRRYTKAYNAKTRKNRVESTDGGTKWWRRTMRLYAREWVSDVDQIEDTELAAAEAREPMPKNIVDFKGHPTYALERHLRRNEVLVRTQEIGRVAAGRDDLAPGGKKLESVYRRRDVKIARSADAWYRLGRDVKMGEQPIKVAPPKNGTGDVDKEDDQAGTNLYSVDQTELYRSPPCVNGRVPKNSFGNIDLFVPSMVPEGGFHVSHDEAARAARILGIDYSDALVGFEFRGRQGTAVLKGIVVAVEYCEAVKAVINAFKDEQAQEEERLRAVAVLKKWRYFLMGLRIKKRIEGYGVEGGKDDDQELELEDDDAEGQSEQYSDSGGGGFFPE